jgi:AcrR family transcriptional regulator
MQNKTEQKIIDAALKLFSEKGYGATKTKELAESAGFAELTLFRKFKSKENLFNMVMNNSIDNFYDEFFLILVEVDSKKSDESFKELIEKLQVLIENNYNFINIFMNERNLIVDDVFERVGDDLSNAIKSLYPKSSVNYRVFALNIISFILAIIFDIKFGSTSLDSKEAIEEFVRYSILNLKN